MLFNNCEGKCPQIPKMSLFKRGIPNDVLQTLRIAVQEFGPNAYQYWVDYVSSRKLQQNIHLKKRVHLLEKFNFFLNHNQPYDLLYFPESFCRSLKTSSNLFFSNGTNSVASKTLIIQMGHKVYWKGKVRHFLRLLSV